jgi:hypothetical protein
MAENETWALYSDASGAWSLDVDELRAALADASKLWLAHDGLWFLEFEKRHGMEEAIEADKAAWSVFTKLEARKIMARLGIMQGEGIPALVEALKHRLYANINQQRIEVTPDGKRARLTMQTCWVQETRRKKGFDDFPCKEVGLVEYSGFAKEIDPRIKTTCSYCPPEAHHEDGFCQWVFEIEE